MTWEVITPAAIAAFVTLLIPIVKSRLSRTESEATVISNQAAALKTAWDRNKDLIGESQDKDRVIVELRKEVERLQAHIGRLELRIDDLERGR